MLKAEVMDQDAFVSVMDDYQGNIDLRKQQYAESKAQNEYDDEEADDEYNVPDPTKEPTTRASIKQGGDLVFSREAARASTKVSSGTATASEDFAKPSLPQPRLQDFVIMRMIGKGTFGKVYLVQH